VSSNEKNAKIRQKGSCGGHVTQFFKFSSDFSVTVEARNIKFGMDTDGSEF